MIKFLKFLIKYFNRISIIQQIIEKIKAKTYLEIGVYSGTCFLKIKAHRKIAVDPIIRIPKFYRIIHLFRNKFYEMTSDDFFREHKDYLLKRSIDVAFIDGLHTYKQLLKDVLNTLKFLNNKGIIIMHDCNPQTEAAATPANSIEEAESLKMPDWKGKWNGDVWKTIIHLRSTQNNLKIFVLDCDYGLGIITKEKPKKLLNYTPAEIKNLTYKDLDSNREK